jgi:hypothetical protein
MCCAVHPYAYKKSKKARRKQKSENWKDRKREK